MIASFICLGNLLLSLGFNDSFFVFDKNMLAGLSTFFFFAVFFAVFFGPLFLSYFSHFFVGDAIYRNLESK